MATRLIENLILDDDPHTVENWLERLDQVIDIALFNADDKLPEEQGARAAKINEIKRSYRLSSLGSVSYKLLKSYCTPDKPNEKSYRDLTKLLQDKLAPKNESGLKTIPVQFVETRGFRIYIDLLYGQGEEGSNVLWF